MRFFKWDDDQKWTGPAIIKRYRQYAERFHVSKRRSLGDGSQRGIPDSWGYPVMVRVIQGIEAHDPACAQIGIELIQEDRGFQNGAIYKSNTAKALRRCQALTYDQIALIRTRVVSMLQSGIVPREYREYAKLLRAVGVGPHRQDIEDATPRNRFAKRAKAYFLNHVLADE